MDAKSLSAMQQDPDAIKLICHLETEAENYRRRCVPQKGQRVFVYPEPEPAKLGCETAVNTITNDVSVRVSIPEYEVYKDIDWDAFGDEFPRI